MDPIGFQEDRSELNACLFMVPGLKDVEGWVYNYFYDMVEPIIAGKEDVFGNPPFYKRQFVDDTYHLSGPEITFFNSREILGELGKKYADFHLKTREIYLKYSQSHAFELIQVYAQCIYWLKGNLDASPYQLGKIKNSNLDWNPMLSFVKKNTEEIISELDWRMNRLNPNNYHNYSPSDDELREYFAAIISKTFNLRDENLFKANFKKIYDLLVPEFFDEKTTVEDLNRMFSGKLQIFAGPIVWRGNVNTLSYFLRQLHTEGKLTKNTFFKIAEKTIADEDGKLFENLKNNKSHPKNDADKIESIVALF